MDNCVTKRKHGDAKHRAPRANQLLAATSASWIIGERMLSNRSIRIPTGEIRSPFPRCAPTLLLVHRLRHRRCCGQQRWEMMKTSHRGQKTREYRTTETAAQLIGQTGFYQLCVLREEDQ
ncbi:Hypothetical predicted protein [Xyrichtys novacula]|uniref:Uncharacterized protein n=1 Tax=Xyrichtys novacula TaxID=13765 RepID=A0AAV1FWV6_XYRNO|nr:Hypothetical predicted protein [Xyrichtys novacula]